MSQVSHKWQNKFNKDKCKVMHFGYDNPKTKYIFEEENYIIGGTPLKETESERDLGVFLSSTPL